MGMEDAITMGYRMQNLKYPTGVSLTQKIPNSYLPRPAGLTDWSKLQRVPGVSVANIQPQTPAGIGTKNFAENVQQGAIGSGAGTPWGLIAEIGATNLMGLFDGLNPHIQASDLLQQAGRSEGYSNGVGYQIQNSVDGDRTLSDYDAANRNKLFSGNLLGFVGGLFGRNKVKDQIEKANLQATRTNTFNRDVAATTGMQMDFKRKYGDQSGQMLYAAHGKDWGMNVMKNLGMIPQQNAWVSKGEGIYNPFTGDAKYVDHGENDTAPAYLKPQDVVFGDLLNPHTGRTFKKDAEPLVLAKEELDKKRPKTNDKNTIETYEKVSAPLRDKLDMALNDLTQKQHDVMTYNNMLHAKHGKDLPKMKLGGWLPNFLASGFNLGTGIAQYFDAKNQDVFKPNSYVKNPYETRALADLDSLRIDPYAILQQMHNAERRGRFSISKSGGLSTGQKLLANVATTANSQNNYANALQSLNEKNISLRSASDMAKLQAGAQNATNMMNALRADNDIYMRSHAARLGGMQTGLFNISNVIQNYMANEDTRQWRNALVDLWSADLRSRRNSIS